MSEFAGRTLTRAEFQNTCFNCPYVRGRGENNRAIRPDSVLFMSATSWMCYIAEYMGTADPSQVNEYISKHGERPVNCPKNEEISKFLES